jgi:hypothetical protein
LCHRIVQAEVLSLKHREKSKQMHYGSDDDDDEVPLNHSVLFSHCHLIRVCLLAHQDNQQTRKEAEERIKLKLRLHLDEVRSALQPASLS